MLLPHIQDILNGLVQEVFQIEITYKCLSV